MFGPKVHPLHIPRGKVKTDGAGVYSQHQHLGHSNNDVATGDNPLVVSKSHVYTIEIPASCFGDNARFIKDVKVEGESLSSKKPSTETENFFLLFQLFSQVAYYAMDLSSRATYNNAGVEGDEAATEETATAEQYFGQSEEENQVYAFIEGIPSKVDSKRDAMVRLWILPQKNTNFGCDFPTMVAKVIGGEDFETKKGKKGSFRNRVPYESFSDNYKRLICKYDKYLQAIYQTRYGRANIAERKKSEVSNMKAREANHNTRGLGSPFNHHNIMHHFSVFAKKSFDENAGTKPSYWDKMKEDGGYMETGDDYKIELESLYPNVDKKYFNSHNYFQEQDNKLIFCPRFREYMFQFFTSELGIRQTLVYSKTRANGKPRLLNKGPCQYMLPVRYVETILKPKQAQQIVEDEMKKLSIQERIDEPSAEVLNTDKMGRYSFGTQSSSFILENTTVNAYPHAENLLSFAAEEGLQEMLLRATQGALLANYAVKRNLIQHNATLSDIEKLKSMREHYVKFTNENIKVFLQEINSKANISLPLLAICKHIETETPDVSPFEFQRNPPSKMHDFLATFMQSDLYEYEYFFCIAHNHKEFLLMIVIGLGSTRIDMMPLSLVVVGPGEGGKSWLQDNLRDSKVTGTTRNCNTSSNMAHTIGHSINCLKLFHEMNIMDTNGGKDPSTRQRVATMKAIAAAGYFQHERVYKDEYTGDFKKTTALLVSCEPKIQATNDPKWDGGDSATRSRHMVKRIKKIELIPEKNVYTKEDAHMGKYYENQKLQALKKKRHLDAVICHWQWFLNDVGVLDNITCFVFPYVQKHIMRKADKTITSKVSTRGITRVKVLTLNLIRLQAWEILFSYKPPFKKFIFTITDTKRDKTFLLDENNDEHKEIVKEILLPNTQQTRFSPAGDDAKYILDKVHTLGPRVFLLKQENLEDNTVNVVGRWEFQTKYIPNEYGLTDNMPPSHVPLVGKYFGMSYNQVLKTPKLQKSFRDDLDSLLYDDTASVVGAFSIGECNFYSYMTNAVLDAFVELTIQKLTKPQQRYYEENDQKNFMYIHIGHNNGSQFYESIKEIVSIKSAQTQGKKINLSELDFKINLAEIQKKSSKEQKWRRPIRVKKIRKPNSDVVYDWPDIDDCYQRLPHIINNTNQPSIQSSIPPTQEEIEEEAQYDLLRCGRSKGSMDTDYFFLIPFARKWATRNTKEDNTTVTGAIKTFSHKYAKPKYVATGNGTKSNEKNVMFPEIGELLHLKPNDEVIVDKQPNVITANAARMLGCNPSLAQQKKTFIYHDLDDLSCLERQAQLFKIPKLASLTRQRIDEALQLPTVKRANKNYLMELVHASRLNKDPHIYDRDGENWFSSAIEEALSSFRRSSTDDEAQTSSNVSHIQSNNYNEEGVICVDEDYDDDSYGGEEKIGDDNNPFTNDLDNFINEGETRQRPTFTNEEMEEVQRAIAMAEEQEKEHQNDQGYMMMTDSITEEKAQEEHTISVHELGVKQIGMDPIRVQSNLIDDEAGSDESRPPPKKKKRMLDLIDEDEDDD